jgi:hypothetical protein
LSEQAHRFTIIRKPRRPVIQEVLERVFKSH